jgi:hypothetical protein
MSDQETMIMLVMADAKHAVKAEDTFEDRLTAAMSAAKNHWMVTDEQLQFKGAIMAVYPSCNPEEQARLKAELDLLKTIAAASSGIPVDVPAVLDRTSKFEGIGLGKLWREAERAST